MVFWKHPDKRMRNRIGWIKPTKAKKYHHVYHGRVACEKYADSLDFALHDQWDKGVYQNRCGECERILTN